MSANEAGPQALHLLDARSGCGQCGPSHAGGAGNATRGMEVIIRSTKWRRSVGRIWLEGFESWNVGEKTLPRTVKKAGKNAGLSQCLPSTIPSPLLQKIMGHKVSVVTANDNLQICTYQCAVQTRASTCLQVSKSPVANLRVARKKISVPRGRSNSISHKPYTSTLPLKNIKDIWAVFKTLAEFKYTGWLVRTLRMALYNPYMCLYLEVV